MEKKIISIFLTFIIVLSLIMITTPKETQAAIEPITITRVNVTTSKVTIRWNMEIKPFAFSFYKVKIMDPWNEDKVLVSNKVKTNSASIDILNLGLLPNRRYKIEVRAYNILGIDTGAYSSTDMFTLPKASDAYMHVTKKSAMLEWKCDSSHSRLKHQNIQINGYDRRSGKQVSAVTVIYENELNTSGYYMGSYTLSLGFKLNSNYTYEVIVTPYVEGTYNVGDYNSEKAGHSGKAKFYPNIKVTSKITKKSTTIKWRRSANVFKYSIYASYNNTLDYRDIKLGETRLRSFSFNKKYKNRKIFIVPVKCTDTINLPDMTYRP